MKRKLLSIIFNLLRLSDDFATDEPSHLSLILMEYNPLLACLCVPFIIFLAIKLIEFFLIQFKFGANISKDGFVLIWLIKNFQISYKSEQIILEDETILLLLELFFCIFGFFIELKWFFLGTLGMIFYLSLYITLSYQDLRNIINRILVK